MSLIILCLKIFFVRIIDVSLGTIRTVLVVKDKVFSASFIGFFEVLIWFIVVKDALNSTNGSFIIAIFYALGFSCGTFVGGLLANYFNNDTMINVQIIINNSKNYIIDMLRDKGFAVTVLNVKGYKEDGKLMLLSSMNISMFKNFKKLIYENDKKAFIVVSDTKAVYNGYFVGNTR